MREHGKKGQGGFCPAETVLAPPGERRVPHYSLDVTVDTSNRDGLMNPSGWRPWLLEAQKEVRQRPRHTTCATKYDVHRTGERACGCWVRFGSSASNRLDPSLVDPVLTCILSFPIGAAALARSPFFFLFFFFFNDPPKHVSRCRRADRCCVLSPRRSLSMSIRSFDIRWVLGERCKKAMAKEKQLWFDVKLGSMSSAHTCCVSSSSQRAVGSDWVDRW